jgi:hypothetical protein
LAARHVFRCKGNVIPGKAPNLHAMEVPWVIAGCFTLFYKLEPVIECLNGCGYTETGRTLNHYHDELEIMVQLNKGVQKKAIKYPALAAT